jgi:hypothetical protein
LTNSGEVRTLLLLLFFLLLLLLFLLLPLSFLLLLQCARMLDSHLQRLYSQRPGTSTFDGLAIAWATARYTMEHLQCRCLFVTHYHALSNLQTSHPKQVCCLPPCNLASFPDVSHQAKNYHMGFMELPRSGEEGPQLVLL